METFGAGMRRLRGEMSLRQLARVAYVDPGHLSRIEAGLRRPTATLAATLDAALNADGELIRLAKIAAPAFPHPPDRGQSPTDPLADERQALELAHRVAASDIGEETIRSLEDAVDDLASAYASTPPALLSARCRIYLGYTSALLGSAKRMTLTEHRRLIETAAWLSLLAATVHIDLGHGGAADAQLRTASALARHAGHAEIEAWTLETRAWAALTAGRHRDAIAHAAAARRIAPAGSSAAIQATAQEGRAWARLGARPETYDRLDQVAAAGANLPRPDRPEHHFRYDPGKADSYMATTLTWVGDPAAESYARDVIAKLVAAGDRPRRVVAAHLDLALALVTTDKPDEAAACAHTAITSGLLVPSNYWRAREVLVAIEARGLPEAADLRDAYETICHHKTTP